MISDEQHGFVEKNQQQHNSSAFDIHSQVDVIYTELNSAFDKLEHEIFW